MVQTVSFNINGDLVSTITPPSALTIDYSFNNTISAIGGRNDHGSGYFTGNISNFAYWESELDQPAITALYNNGTPEVTISQSPNHWFTLKDFATGSVDQIGSLNYEDSTPSALEFPDNFVSTEAVQSSGLTERSLVNNNVSALNGESSGMNSTNLVQSNLTRKVPFSNYSFNFDSGSSEVIDITNNSIFNLGTSFTISGWFNFSSNKYQGLISFDSSSTRGWFLFQFSDNSILLFDGTTSYTLKTSYTTTNQWDNFIVTYDGSNLIFYINGAQESTQSVSINLQANGNDGQIGNNQFASGRFFNGKMSNIALLDRALTEQEVLKIYNNGVPQDLQATSSFSNNILAWWPMDERSSYYDGTDWVVRDLINGNDGGGINTGGVEDLVGNAPGSEASGVGSNFVIGYLEGNMKDSKLNAYSINMADYADGVTNPADSGRSTDVP